MSIVSHVKYLMSKVSHVKYLKSKIISYQISQQISSYAKRILSNIIHDGEYHLNVEYSWRISFHVIYHMSNIIQLQKYNALSNISSCQSCLFPHVLPNKLMLYKMKVWKRKLQDEGRLQQVQGGQGQRPGSESQVELGKLSLKGR